MNDEITPKSYEELQRCCAGIPDEEKRSLCVWYAKAFKDKAFSMTLMRINLATNIIESDPEKLSLPPEAGYIDFTFNREHRMDFESKYHHAKRKSTSFTWHDTEYAKNSMTTENFETIQDEWILRAAFYDVYANEIVAINDHDFTEPFTFPNMANYGIIK